MMFLLLVKVKNSVPWLRNDTCEVTASQNSISFSFSFVASNVKDNFVRRHCLQK